MDAPARRRLVRAGMGLGLALGLPAATVLVSLAAIRTAGAEAWGTVVGAMILVQLAAQVADFGSRDALVRAFARDPASVPSTWRRAAASRAPLLALGPALFVAGGNDPARTVVMCAWLVALFVGRLHDAMIAWRRAFGLSLAVELTVACVTLVGIAAVAGGPDAPDRLVAVLAMGAAIRALVLAVRFHVLRQGPGWRFDRGELRRSWPFFGLSFSGAIQSRVDLYVVAALLPAPLLAAYQVLTTLVLLVQSMAGALLGPIVPALHRLGRPGVLRGARRLAVLGGVVCAAAVPAVAFVMGMLYGLPVEPAVLVLAGVAMLPVYGYLPLVHLAFREGDERAVLLANLAGIAVAGGGALLLVPTFGLVGAVGAAALAQVAILALHVVRTGARRSPTRRSEAVDALPGV